MSHVSLPKSRAIIEIILHMNANVLDASRAYLPGPYSACTENLVNTFCNWYLRQLQASDGNNTDIPS
jgi:hypothetical protein